MIGAAVIGLATAGVAAAESPLIVASGDNAVPRCVTPQRLTQFLKSRNPTLEKRFEKIAEAYQRIGRDLGVRYDYAFFQMMAETGSLSFKGGRARQVKAEQNNFAGLGAVGNAEPGESFPDLDTGVKAHLQHIMLYAGQQVQDPVAERTRKVQQWNILADWQRENNNAITFEEMAKKWTKPTAVYPSLIDNHANAFMGQFCKGQEKEEAPIAQAPERPRGQDLARQAQERARAEGVEKKAALGAGAVPPPSAQQPRMNILNREPPQTVEPQPQQAAPAPAPQGQRVAAVAVPKAPVKPEPPAANPVAPAAAPGTAATALPKTAIQPNGPVPGGNCRVWTASYGGTRGVIVRWIKEGVVNFTVIDVNPGAEQKEAKAFIDGYTKNGVIAGNFQTQAQALEKAFEYCPEG
jgi:hypothetical protein